MSVDNATVGTVNVPKTRKRERVAAKMGWGYITPHGREHAKTYKYRGQDLSLIYKYFSSPLAEYLVKRWTPSWLAPNTITFIGLCFIVASYLALVSYCGDFQCTDDMPSWPWFLAAFCLFAYGTLDNMDGKQARATGSSSPLGLLFDHGCDALNTCIFTTQNALFVSQVGSDTLISLALFSTLAGGFYLATWEEFHLDSLVLPIINGPNEGLLAMCIAFIATGVFGVSSLQFPFAWGYKLNEFLVLLACLAAVATMLYQVSNVCVQLTGERNSIWRPLGRLSPLALVTGTAWAWATTTPELYQHHPLAFLSVQGILITDAVSKLMVSHVCNQRFRPNWTLLLLYGGCGFGVMAAQRFMGTAPSLQAQVYLLWALLAATWGALLFFIFYAVNELADALGVRVFKIAPKKQS